MLPREEKYIYDWENSRGKGKWTYILLTAFMWGTIVPLVYKLIYVVTHFGLDPEAFTETFVSRDYLWLWLKFMAGFFLFALIMWQLSFRKYKELKRKQASREHFREMTRL